MAIQPKVVLVPLGKALAAIALAALTAVLTYMYTARLNVETAVQQQQSAAIQQFEQSGAQMDSSLSQFVDTLLDKRAVVEARTAARTAINLHASQAGSLRSLTGSGNVDQYVNGLGDLRKLTDTADGRLTAQRMAQQHVNLMAYRVKLVALARSNVYR